MPVESRRGSSLWGGGGEQGWQGVNIGRRGVGWIKGVGELVEGFVTRLLKWTNVLSDFHAFESSTATAAAITTATTSAATTTTIVKQYKESRVCGIIASSLFTLASMDKQTGTHSQSTHTIISTHIRIRTETRARVYLCIICELSSSPDIITNRNTNRNTRIWTWYLHKYVENPQTLYLPPSPAFYPAAPSCISSFFNCPIPESPEGEVRSYSCDLGWVFVVSLSLSLCANSCTS